jgi:hypothetical protein
MLHINFLVIALSALVPTVIGFIWYHPKVLGTIWMQETGVTMESGKSMNMPVVMIVSYFLSFLLGMALNFIVIHQFGLMSMLQNVPDLANPDSEVAKHVKFLMDNYGANFRSFRHGALHGTITGIFLALPIIATSAMFERRSFKYIALTAAYWTLTMAVMGALICHFQ